jgi:hypothetical protein
VGGSNGGVSISRGCLFLGLGNVLAGWFNQPSSIAAVGVDQGRDR